VENRFNFIRLHHIDKMIDISGMSTQENRSFVNRFKMTMAEIVENDHLVTVVKKASHGMTADISCSARYKYFHKQLLNSFIKWDFD